MPGKQETSGARPTTECMTAQSIERGSPAGWTHAHRHPCSRLDRTWTECTGTTAEWVIASLDGGDITMSSDGVKQVAAPFGGNLFYSTDTGVTWTEVTGTTPSGGSPVPKWQAVTSSSDGTLVLAVMYNGGFWFSRDSGTLSPQLLSAPRARARSERPDPSQCSTAVYAQAR